MKKLSTEKAESPFYASETISQSSESWMVTPTHFIGLSLAVFLSLWILYFLISKLVKFIKKRYGMTFNEQCLKIYKKLVLFTFLGAWARILWMALRSSSFTKIPPIYPEDSLFDVMKNTTINALPAVVFIVLILAGLHIFVKTFEFCIQMLPIGIGTLAITSIIQSANEIDLSVVEWCLGITVVCLVTLWIIHTYSTDIGGRISNSSKQVFSVFLYLLPVVLGCGAIFGVELYVLLHLLSELSLIYRAVLVFFQFWNFYILIYFVKAYFSEILKFSGKFSGKFFKTPNKKLDRKSVISSALRRTWCEINEIVHFAFTSIILHAIPFLLDYLISQLEMAVVPGRGRRDDLEKSLLTEIVISLIRRILKVLRWFIKIVFEILRGYSMADIEIKLTDLGDKTLQTRGTFPIILFFSILRKIIVYGPAILYTLGYMFLILFYQSTILDLPSTTNNLTSIMPFGDDLDRLVNLFLIPNVSILVPLAVSIFIIIAISECIITSDVLQSRVDTVRVKQIEIDNFKGRFMYYGISKYDELICGSKTN